ncbi:MAG: ECF transporter S component [Clostridia bacterium]|nr:ECF transporter S component [Clostridia bacterium]
MLSIKLTRLQKQIVLTVLMLVVMVLVTWLTGLLGRMRFITRSTGGAEEWAGIYVSLGDAVVYLLVLVLGGPWGALVAAVGAVIADLLLGATERIIGSLIVNAGMAFFIAAFCRLCTDWRRCLAVAGVAEGIMLVGYFIFDLLIMREFSVAGLAFLVDLGQGLVCGLLGALLLKHVRPLRPDKLPDLRRPR